MTRRILILLFVVALALPVFAQAPSQVTGADLKAVLPTTYFFRGLSATVQARNAGVLKYNDGKFLMTALVDTSGYSSGVAEEYQGLFITEKPVNIGGQVIPPGQYGFGFNKAGKFHIMDVAMKELAAVDATTDSELKRPQPLKLTVQGDEVRLYLGRKYASFKVE